MSTDTTYVSLSVIDNGQGIAHENLPQVFDPFFSTKAPSRGLGLPFVREVVRTHGGFVDVHSEFGQGTTVTIHLPITRRYQPRTPYQQRLKAGAVNSPPSH
jgi:signal transduction histidine kinase